MLTDPTVEEEDLCSGSVAIVVKNNELCSVHKPGGSPLLDEKLLKCINSSKVRAQLVDKLIHTAIGIPK